VDAVHGGNACAMRAAVRHGGGLDEAVNEAAAWVALRQLPEQVSLVLFVAAASCGGCLADAGSGVVRVVDEVHGGDVAQFPAALPAGSVSSAGVLLMMKRTGDRSWALLRLEEYAKSGRHFMDILEPTLGRIIRQAVPELPRRHRAAVSFASMERGAVVELPQSAAAKWLFIGVGWDLGPAALGEGGGADIVVSAVLFDAAGRDLGAVLPDGARQQGARHCGGGPLGAGVVLEPEALPQDVAQVFVVGHVTAMDASFDLLQRPHCCVIDPAGSELLRYTLTESASEPGLIMARIFRDVGRKRWGFQALGGFCPGHGWAQSLAEMGELCRRAPQELQPVPEDACSSAGSRRSIVSL